MVLFITFLTALVCFMFTFLILNIIYRDKIQILVRLSKIKENRKAEKDMDELNVPFHERIIKPIGGKLSDIITKITPGGAKKRIEERLISAGRPFNIQASQWFLIKFVLGVIIPLIYIIYLFFNNMLFSRTSIFISIVIAIINLFPSMILQQVTKNRQKQIVNSLPDVLDLLTVSVEAGLSFDGALGRLVDSMPGVLSAEFNRVLNEMKMGKSRREALKDMSIRCGVSDLTTLVGALIQADELGVGVSKVLRVQSVQMREKRRQRAQEKAMKAPVKMLFPLILFIFPSIFAVLLGPAVIRMINTFGGK